MKLLIIPLLLSLSGCSFSPYKTNFDCPVGQGVPCTRLSQINEMIDSEELTNEQTALTKNSSKKCRGCASKSEGKSFHITYMNDEETRPSDSEKARN